MHPYLFVYGTLRTDRRRHSRVPDLTLLGDLVGLGVASGRLYQVHPDYPGLVTDGPDCEDVPGQLWKLTDPVTAFEILDEYEGGEYERRLARIRVEGAEWDAWVYCWVESV